MPASSPLQALKDRPCITGHSLLSAVRFMCRTGTSEGCRPALAGRRSQLEPCRCVLKRRWNKPVATYGTGVEADTYKKPRNAASA